jgi:hypothetical protein
MTIGSVVNRSPQERATISVFAVAQDTSINASAPMHENRRWAIGRRHDVATTPPFRNVAGGRLQLTQEDGPIRQDRDACHVVRSAAVG